MPNSVTSPSDFIYQKPASSPLNPFTEDHINIQAGQQWQRTTCGKLPSMPCVRPPWETEIPGPSETNRRATYPAPEAPHGNEHRRQERVPPITYAPVLRNTHLPAPDHALPQGMTYGQYAHRDHLFTHRPDKDSWKTDDDDAREPEFRASPDPSSRELAKHYDPSSASIVPSPTESHTLSIHRPSSSSTERANHICATVRAVHDICLQSSKTYLNTHLTNFRARDVGSSSPPLLNQPSGYLANPNIASAGNSSVAGGGSSNDVSTILTPTDSLLTNISSICSMLWANSQHNRLAVVNIERLAVDNMGRLLMWAEAVALGDYDEWQNSDEATLGRVISAGNNLCGWLGVPEGMQAMKKLERDVAEKGRRDGPQGDGTLGSLSNGFQGYGTYPDP
ncbi:hypothetical protein F5Y04DRAFT_112944 [Hypomontagnella monticulosa]|nr:hypothetical protein F5Y04DRAFT_112944 [Hypomontagnella monticulosa]